MNTGSQIPTDSSFPWDYSNNQANDGVVILHTTLPGSRAPYHLGHTAVHAVRERSRSVVLPETVLLIAPMSCVGWSLGRFGEQLKSDSSDP